MLVAAMVALLVLLWDSVRGLRWRQFPESVDEVQFLGSIAAELRAGSSLRASLAAASADGVGPLLRRAHRLAIAGAPLGEIGDVLAALPISGRRVGVALRVASNTGGRSAAIFGRLADRAVDEAALNRERRSLTAQVRMSAAVVVGIPVLSLVFGGGARIGELAAAGGGGLIVAATGLAMQVVGGLAVWWMART